MRFQLTAQTFGIAEAAGVEAVVRQPVGCWTQSASQVCPDLVQKTLLALAILTQRDDAAARVVVGSEFGGETHPVPGLQLGPGPQEMQVKTERRPTATPSATNCRPTQPAHQCAQDRPPLRFRIVPGRIIVRCAPLVKPEWSRVAISASMRVVNHVAPVGATNGRWNDSLQQRPKPRSRPSLRRNRCARVRLCRSPA